MITLQIQHWTASASLMETASASLMETARTNPEVDIPLHGSVAVLEVRVQDNVAVARVEFAVLLFRPCYNLRARARGCDEWQLYIYRQ